MVQLRGFLHRLPGPLIKINLPLTNNVLITLANIVLIRLEVTAVASTADAKVPKKS